MSWCTFAPAVVFSSSQDRQAFRAACCCTRRAWSAKLAVCASIKWIIPVGSDAMIRNRRFQSLTPHRNSCQLVRLPLPIQATREPPPPPRSHQMARTQPPSSSCLGSTWWQWPPMIKVRAWDINHCPIELRICQFSCVRPAPVCMYIVRSSAPPGTMPLW